MSPKKRIHCQIYANTMVKVVDCLLVKGSAQDQPTKALIFTTRIDFNDFQSEEEPDPVGGFLHVACFAPMNYVHVLAAFTDRPVLPSDFGGLSWQPIACHDSCWREDGVKSVIEDAVRILNRSAIEAFKIEENEISMSIHLHALESNLEGAEDVLKSGLSQEKRHGHLLLPMHGSWS